MGCITPLFYCCVRVCCGCYVATASVYRIRLETSLYATVLNKISEILDGVVWTGSISLRMEANDGLL
jgi:hypothetical protein